MIWNEPAEGVLNVGKSMLDSGIANYALTRVQALTALESLSKCKVGVAGGDVYLSNQGGFESTYDNWYCDHIPGESEGVYVERSIALAIQYIQNYNAESAFFVIVPSS